MWPRPRRRGIADTPGELDAAVSGASIRPPPRGRGINAHPDVSAAERAASMWPRPRGRGIFSTRSTHNPAQQLQCGHGRAAVESSNSSEVPLSRQEQAMWPRPRGRGITAACGTPRATLPGFYGARAARPWNLNTRSLIRSKSRCFNVATAARPWNPCVFRTRKGSICRFTWPRPRGRGIVFDGVFGQVVLSASTWPRPRGRGIVTPQLQHSIRGARFHVGPRPRGRGIGKRQRQAKGSSPGFNVATAARPGYQGGSCRRGGRQPGFNVATAARPWNHRL